MRLTLSLFALKLLELILCEVESPTQIIVMSPRSDVKQPAGQDLVVKFHVENQIRCSVVAILNGKSNKVIPSCKISFAIDADELLMGSNELELLLQSDNDQTDGVDFLPSTVVLFDVEQQTPWYNPTSICSDASEGTCDRCIHWANDVCTIWNTSTPHTIPRIFHWVWVGGGGPIPQRFDRYMSSWRTLHPDWQFVVWTDDLVNWPLRNAALIIQADSYAGLGAA